MSWSECCGCAMAFYDTMTQQKDCQDLNTPPLDKNNETTPCEQNTIQVNLYNTKTSMSIIRKLPLKQ